MLSLGGTLSLLMTHSGYLQVRRHGFEDFWTIGGMVVVALMGAFWIWAGSDELKRAGGAVVNKPGFRWGRLLTGIWFVFFALKSHFAPSAIAFKADNEGEASGMFFGTVLLVGIGLSFMVMSIQPRKPEVQQEDSLHTVLGK